MRLRFDLHLLIMNMRFNMRIEVLILHSLRILLLLEIGGGSQLRRNEEIDLEIDLEIDEPISFQVATASPNHKE